LLVVIGYWLFVISQQSLGIGKITNHYQLSTNNQ